MAVRSGRVVEPAERSGACSPAASLHGDDRAEDRGRDPGATGQVGVDELLGSCSWSPSSELEPSSRVEPASYTQFITAGQERASSRQSRRTGQASQTAASCRPRRAALNVVSFAQAASSRHRSSAGGADSLSLLSLPQPVEDRFGVTVGHARGHGVVTELPRTGGNGRKWLGSESASEQDRHQPAPTGGNALGVPGGQEVGGSNPLSPTTSAGQSGCKR